MNFDKMFIDSRGKAVEFEGEQIVRVDRVNVDNEFSGELRIISTNSSRKQFINIKVEGEIMINGKKGEKARVWEGKTSSVTKFEGRSKNNELLIWNGWERSDGLTESWTNGGAMKVELDGNTRRYQCNDFDADAQFDDLVFEIEMFK